MKRVHAALVSIVVILVCLIRHLVVGLSNLTIAIVATPGYTDEGDIERLRSEIHESQSKPPTQALSDSDSLLFVSTLDGTLNAVSKSTGRTVWTLKETPVLTTPVNIDKSPMFLTNPKDGSLYTFGGGFKNLKKLPFTIPDLVTTSPCRSSDGILYSGYKKDTWFAIDPLTGTKVQTLSMDGLQSEVCPSGIETTMLIGRTEYTLVMFDSATSEIRWNATFMDYSSHATEAVDHHLRHFASSSSGAVVTMDDADGDVLWKRDYGSPVVAMYVLDAGRGLRNIPFVSFAGETLEHLTGQVTSTEWRARFLELGNKMDGVGKTAEEGDSDDVNRFYPTLYIGEQATCFYALPALVDSQTVTIVARNYQPLLIEGPLNSEAGPVTPGNDASGGFLMLGYHEEPGVAEAHISGLGIARRQIADNSIEVLYPSVIPPFNVGDKLEFDPIVNSSSEATVIKNGQTISDGAYFTAALCMFIFIVGFACVMRWRKQPPPSAPDDLYKVGAISFDPTAVLGHGCAGTFVYRGRFDGRDVAVKRLLPKCFTIADREVALLRESDQHPHVVRYYVTECDAQFRYIALELCAATLQEYVEGRGDAECMGLDGTEEPVRFVLEAMKGIAHLHSLEIVHRDVKPNNVLLSRPDSGGVVRAMISDFGLCKKLSVGSQSVSKSSGLTGTNGWIAPEMLATEEPRTTCAVDIFSAGCLIFYAITGGLHPFGGALYRQANILAGHSDLSALDASATHRQAVAYDLVEAMTQCEPTARPTAQSVLRHPLFWDGSRALAFFEAVSDKVEKLGDMEAIVLRLESGGLRIVKTNWINHITEELRKDLRRFRSYKGHSVRDLLRAMRNKRHHFRELEADLRASLGESPDDFVGYFTTRFPRLLAHAYDAMSSCADESAFAQFY